ncbi:dicarboxylate/amino acid:cation symporter [Clostridium cylindrosporum]|uniref:Na+/H+-dicarboxylate symporter n=1 Tax=Clostridium cylindrosporum DSM 605 TaxID=1121307 RepID=A0A0J8DD50_CLOCY|nr:dicarboxylate/amino acid:cation symporter [Clostridium cylindrosporum]KMT22173.1 Na+/H+-dicarboxylate symporter [Clostridium cylindrosporum DSM 605]
MKKFGLLPRIILSIILGLIIGSVSPRWVIGILSTFNGLFTTFLSFIIPLLIIALVAPGIGELGKGAGRLLGITAGIAYISTIFAGTLAYTAGRFVFPKILTQSATLTALTSPKGALVKPYFTIGIPPIMDVMAALVLAFILGLGIASSKEDVLLRGLKEFSSIIVKVIAKIIVPLLPIYILGIFANMTFAGQIVSIITMFAKVIIMVISLQFLLIAIQYTIASIVSKKNPFRLLRNMLPAYVTAIGTQSSAATIPVVLERTKKNGVKNRIADFVIPLCATVHLAGSTVNLTTCSMAVVVMSGGDISIGRFFPFILMLGVTMVAAPGVPGGAVMAAIGLLKSILLLPENIISIIVALHLAQDSFGTACNVTGDGAIAVIVDKISEKVTT